MVGDRVVGLIFTVGYTLLVIAGIQADASGAIQDLVSWAAVLLLFLSYGLFLISDQQVIELAGGRYESVIRNAALVIQVILLAWSGWWWTVGFRVSTEIISGIAVMRSRHRTRIGFKVDQDEQGLFFIRCYQCGQHSYNQNDIEQLYCGGCNKFHGHNHQRQPAT